MGKKCAEDFRCIMPTSQRFTLGRTAANAWYIRDNSDGSVVCMVIRGSRGESKTKAMVNVMLDALNNEAAKRSEKAAEISNY